MKAKLMSKAFVYLINLHLLLHSFMENLYVLNSDLEGLHLVDFDTVVFLVLQIH